HDKTKDLGFAGYSDLCDQLRSLDLSSLTKQMEDLLDETRGVFYQRLEAFLDTIDVPSKQAGTCDILYLFRAPNFDGLFSKEPMIPALTTTLAGMGIDLDRQGNLELDVEPRPLKSPRAFCAPIRVPQEVKLVIKP
ncbi:MAG: hypothetical protein GTO63_01440, partial [Anaerolineae bacterium]|nr:hypothetical protein [Anaerolineae bacterium]NIN93712.1 hypothetical protein [Anaerolineae bacterium]NIQ78015.1 hypothetical protein [Anaerolineae bacterium]